MHGVVAVFHEHSEELAELHGESYASTWTQAIHVLAASLPRWHIGCAPVAGKNLAFFKVDVNRMIPAAAGVLESPDFARTRCGRRGDPAIVGLQHGSTVCLHAPGIFVRWIGKVLGATAELKRPFPYHRDVRK